MQPDSPDASRSQSMWGNLVLGLKVLGGESKWALLNLVRAMELRQLAKRLRDEHAALGEAIERSRMPADEDSASDFEERIALRLKQIAFLREEIGFLVKEQKRQRQGFEQQRLQHLGLKKETGETGDD